MKTVIEMAREAGLLEPDDTEEEIRECGIEVWLFGERGIKAFEHFAELVRADEREACAKVCEEPTEQTYEVTTSWDGFESTRQMRLAKTDRDCAAAIRARSST